MQTRFKESTKIISIVMNALAITLSVGTMIYGIFHFGLSETWPELVLNVFYIACVVMIWLYFFNTGITTQQFNYWCSISVGITILLRDILFPPQLAYYPIQLACSTLSIVLLCLLVYFYARKDWQSYTKWNLWMIYIIDVLIALLYHIDILLEPSDEYTKYLITEIWIRPTITYGLVACFVSENQNN